MVHQLGISVQFLPRQALDKKRTAKCVKALSPRCNHQRADRENDLYALLQQTTAVIIGVMA